METDAIVARGKKGQQSRERLLAAAASEFAHTGYHETKVSTIVGRAGLTQAAFYLYFPSKEAIFAELIADLRNRLRLLAGAARLTPGLTAHDLPGRIQATMETGFRFLQENADVASIGLFIAPEAEEIKADIVASIAANLRAEREAGYIRPEVSIDIAAEGLFGIMIRLAQSHLFPGKEGPASLGAQAADLILHGLFTMADPSVTSRAIRHDEGKGTHHMVAKYLAPDEGELVRLLGEPRVIKISPAENGGTLLQFETAHAPGTGAPLHLHRDEDEAFYVLAGQYEFTVGDRQMTATTGAFAFVPRGTVHAFTNTGQEGGRMLVTVTPGTGHEGLLREVKEVTERLGRPPETPQLLALALKYGWVMA